jgi:EAL domain-containing protein (putative c-di-GMP-specific phosphodiesterase class I)
VIDLSHNLGKQVCAEGVENETTWRLLEGMECDLAQGYWISEPVSSSDLIAWLADTAWGMKVLPTRSSQSIAR